MEKLSRYFVVCFAVVLLVVAACAEKPQRDEADDDSSVPDSSENQETQVDSILIPTKTVIDVGAEGGDISLGITANIEYTVSVSVPWLHYTPSKALNTDYISIEVDGNNAYGRSATVWIESGNYSSSVTIKQESGYTSSGGPIPICHLMPCCRTFNTGTKFLLGDEWVSSHNYGDISQVRCILEQVQDAGINIVSIDFTNPSQWDDVGESAAHGGDGGEFWQQFKPMIDNIALVCEERGMKFFFFIGNTVAWGLDYWNDVAGYILDNWAYKDVYHHYGYGDERPMLVVFLPGTEYAKQISSASASQISNLEQFRIGTCEVNTPINPTSTDGWGYRNFSSSSDGKVRFACPNGGVPPSDWYRISASLWERRVKWAMDAKEYAVLGSYDDTCDAIFWGIADVRRSYTKYHYNESTIEDPYAYYDIVRKTLNKNE